jgi:hypothetical protein
MSDFFRHGLISTLHQLSEQPRPLELTSGRGKIGLILPCHYRDFASAALISIGTWRPFNRIPFAQSHETGIAKRFHERLEEIIGEFTDGARAVPLPPWNQSAESVEMPDFPVLQACS